MWRGNRSIWWLHGNIEETYFYSTGATYVKIKFMNDFLKIYDVKVMLSPGHQYAVKNSKLYKVAFGLQLH